MGEKFEGELYWFRVQAAAERACGTKGRPLNVPPTLKAVDHLMAKLSKVPQTQTIRLMENELLEMRQALSISTSMDDTSSVPV